MGAEPHRKLGNPGVWLEALQWVSSQKHDLIPLHTQLTRTKILPEMYNSITTAPTCLQQLSGTGELHFHQVLQIAQSLSKGLSRLLSPLHCTKVSVTSYASPAETLLKVVFTTTKLLPSPQF